MSESWPDPIRRIVGAVNDTLAAAEAKDADRFRDATAAAARLEQSKVEALLGGAIRSLLEDQHPAGLSGDDARDLLQRTVRGASTWYAEVDVDVMILVITGALGVHEVDQDQPPVRAASFVSQSSLLADELLRTGGQKAASYLRAAVAEIQRAETMEMP